MRERGAPVDLSGPLFERCAYSVADRRVDDEVGSIISGAEHVARWWRDLDDDRVGDRLQPCDECRSLVHSDVFLSEVLADEEPAGHLSGVPDRDAGRSGADELFGDPRSKCAAAEDADPAPSEPGNRALVVSARRDTGTCVIRAYEGELGRCWVAVFRTLVDAGSGQSL